ncbi:MAG: hypothetical protein ABW154_07460 [Dyella sp.]
MNHKEYQYLEDLSDRELFDFVTEADSSQRKHVAVHLLELRRNQEMTRVAKSSARAAWLAALIAGVAAVVAILAQLKGGST